MSATWEECNDPYELLRRSRQYIVQERFRWLSAEYVDQMKYVGCFCQDIGESWTKGFVDWVRGQGPIPTGTHDTSDDFDYSPARAPSPVDIAKDLIIRNIQTRQWAQLSINSFTVVEDQARRYEPMIHEMHKPKSKTKLAKLKAQEEVHCLAWRDSLTARVNSIKEAFCNSFRDVAGNPFEPVVFEPRWRTDTVMALARGSHAEAAFDRIPILADAMEEAGCDHPEILRHCRSQQLHGRGCWVISELFEDRWD